MKKRKLEWHQTMKPRAYAYVDGKCQQCDIQIATTDEGVVHHVKYPSGVYERDVEGLIDEGICLWLCRKCHEAIHLSFSVEDGIKPGQRGGYCHYCNKLNYGGWQRGNLLGLEYCLCRKCFKTIKEMALQQLPDSTDNIDSSLINNTRESQVCKKCSAPLEKRYPRRQISPTQTYYFEYYFFCANCRTTYMTNSAKRYVEGRGIPMDKDTLHRIGKDLIND